MTRVRWLFVLVCLASTTPCAALADEASIQALGSLIEKFSATKEHVEAIGVQLAQLEREGDDPMPGADDKERAKSINTAINYYGEVRTAVNALIDRIVFELTSSSISITTSEYTSSLSNINTLYRQLVVSYNAALTSKQTAFDDIKTGVIKQLIIAGFENIKKIWQGGPSYRVKAAEKLEQLKIAHYLLAPGRV